MHTLDKHEKVYIDALTAMSMLDHDCNAVLGEPCKACTTVYKYKEQVRKITNFVKQYETHDIQTM